MPSFTFYFQSPHSLTFRPTFSRRYDLRPTTLRAINSANQLHPPTDPSPLYSSTTLLPPVSYATHPSWSIYNIPTHSTAVSSSWTALQMEPENPSETFEPTYHSTRRYIPQDWNFHYYRSMNCRFRVISVKLTAEIYLALWASYKEIIA